MFWVLFWPRLRVKHFPQMFSGSINLSQFIFSLDVPAGKKDDGIWFLHSLIKEGTFGWLQVGQATGDLTALDTEGPGCSGEDSSAFYSLSQLLKGLPSPLVQSRPGPERALNASWKSKWPGPQTWKCTQTKSDYLFFILLYFHCILLKNLDSRAGHPGFESQPG